MKDFEYYLEMSRVDDSIHHDMAVNQSKENNLEEELKEARKIAEFYRDRNYNWVKLEFPDKPKPVLPWE